MTDFLNEFLARAPAGEQRRLPTSFKALVAQAVARNAQRMAVSAFGRRVAQADGFALDMDSGLLTLRFGDEEVVVKAQVAGTTAADGFFVWGWGHPSVPEPMQAAAWAVKRFADAQKIDELLDRKAQVTPKRAADYAALTAYLSDASGVYVGDYGSGQVHLAYFEESET